MNKLSAMSVAGVLLLLASAPATAQGYYPPDPGYGEGSDSGLSEAPETLPPGADFGVDPAYGGFPDTGDAYPEEDYGYARPGGAPVYGGEDQRPRYRQHFQRRFGDDSNRGDDRFGRDERRRAGGDFGRNHLDRSGEPRHRRQHPSNQEGSDQ